MKDYEINEFTLAIIPDCEGTRIYEQECTFISPKSVNTIVDESCQYFGSSLEGRQKGTANLIGVRIKSPIIVEETRNIIFFPTASPKIANWAWISFNNLESYQGNSKKSVVVFNNHQAITLDVSYSIIDNQVLRAARLDSTLRKRKENSKNNLKKGNIMV